MLRHQPQSGLDVMFPIWEWCFVRIIKQSTLAKFAAANPRAKPAITRWIKLVRAAKWASMNEVQMTVPGSAVLNGERARFEIAGGNFRLIVAFAFKHQIAFIKFVGTHAEYDKIDALTVAMY
ncbi:type II toxin-antitoxin system HigB family toxin [Bradyrhizobium sp. A5]|uniref:type II toxin-antitoxin system HigB family toxin n=1 Tax=Bradyrhizobium sp. A5 TaxID=3133696 RepID=UPI003255992F